MSETVSLWRCTVCGRWSHAVRMPRTHVRNTTDQPAAGLKVLEHHEESLGPDAGSYGDYDPDVIPEWWKVECGPFERWVALPEPTGRRVLGLMFA